MEYDARVRRTLMNIEEGANQIYYNLNFFQNRMVDAKYYSSVTTYFNLDSLFVVHPETFRIREKEKGDVFEYLNHLQYYNGNINLRIRTMENLLGYATAIINLIRREYHLN